MLTIQFYMESYNYVWLLIHVTYYLHNCGSSWYKLQKIASAEIKCSCTHVDNFKSVLYIRSYYYNCQ